ncbi:MAG: class I SAM-dependent methyltransferase [Marivibrio sp.]|uniref:class I SAM-dependent methyltransferase n=1 Tax=Marivibrio sp. TaxID=2039719 RepID=UPI0032EFBE20
MTDPHAAQTAPSPWIARFEGAAPPDGPVLDLACGGGRHGRLFLKRGRAVVFLDRDLSGVADLAETPGAELIEADLEGGGPFPLAGRSFAAVAVVNYLWRPILADIAGAVQPGGLLLYETFLIGNEAFGRPKNPDFLLREGELATLAAAHGFEVLDLFEGRVETPSGPAMKGRMAARKG